MRLQYPGRVILKEFLVISHSVGCCRQYRNDLRIQRSQFRYYLVPHVISRIIKKEVRGIGSILKIVVFAVGKNIVSSETEQRSNQGYIASTTSIVFRVKRSERR